MLSQKRADGWFAKQKQEVDTAFEGYKKKYAGQTFGAQQNWQNPTGPPSGQKIAGAGGAAPSDFTSNPHHNWLMDKVASHAPASRTLSAEHGVWAAFDKQMSAIGDDAPWQAFATHMSDSGKEFLAALKKFGDAIWSIIKDPSSFATTAIPDFIDMVNLLVDALLDLCDAMVDVTAALAVAAMDAIEAVLTTELPLGFLNTLWSWIATAAGYPTDDKLTLCSLGALLAAFPCTIIYKLILGVENEPFPNGNFPVNPQAPDTANAAQFGVKMPWQSVLTSDIARMVQVIPAGFADFYGNDAPWWLTGIGVLWSMGVWVLRHGYPTLSVEGWATLSPPRRRN